MIDLTVAAIGVTVWLTYNVIAFPFRVIDALIPPHASTTEELVAICSSSDSRDCLSLFEDARKRLTCLPEGVSAKQLANLTLPRATVDRWHIAPMVVVGEAAAANFPSCGRGEV